MAPLQPANDVFPSLSAQPISVDFIENRQKLYRDAQGELPCTFDPSSQKFVARPLPWETAFDDSEEELRQSKLMVVATTESFSKALLTLKEKNAGDKTIASFDLESCHDWKEITERIQVVADSYHNKGTTWRKIRSTFRRVGDNAKSLQTFVSLLPDGEYKTLCGGLTLILTVRFFDQSFLNMRADEYCRPWQNTPTSARKWRIC